ncbi:MAG: acylphosphatase [Smithella sp.]
MKRVRLHICGLVQGVCFRAATRQIATKLNLTGWVRNMKDRRVEAIFEGEDAAVEKIVEWCQVGPPSARVDKVIMMEEQYTGLFSGFSIKY